MMINDIDPEDFLRTFSFLDDLDVMLVVLDKEWKVKFMNKKACEFFGVTRQDVVGKDLLLETNICEKEELRGALSSKINRGEYFKQELRALTKDGRFQTATFEFGVFRKEWAEWIVGVGALTSSPTRDWLKFLDLLIEERTEALRESEKYRELVELAKSIIFKWDAEGKVIWMNEYGLKFFGFTEEEIVGRSVYETIVPRVESTGRDLSTLVRDIVEKEEEYSSNINENVKKDGTRVWIHWSNRPIKDSKGNLLAILSIGTDITDRIKMEKMRDYELKKSRALSKLYSLLVSPAIKIGDVEAAILSEAMEITESRCGFVGRIDPRTGELVSNKIVQEPECMAKEKKIKLQRSNDKPKSLIEFVLSNKKPFYTNSPKDHPAYKGEPEWHVKIERFLVAPMLVEGKVTGILALANSKRDYGDHDLEAVSEMSRYFVLAMQRINYEEELILRENLYQTLFENAPVPTLLVDENGILSNVNAAFEKLSGYTKEEVEGKKIWKEFVFEEDLKKMEAYRAERLAGRYAPPSYEFRFLDKKMNVHDVLVNVSIIPGTKKIIASFIDLTDIKRLQEELKRSKEELERYSKHLEEVVEERTRELREKERLAAIGEAATSIAHDLKSPLQVLINSVYIAKMGISKLPAPMVEQLKSSGVLETLSKIEKQIGYINRILLDLQEISRPIKPEAVNVNLITLVKESLQSVTVPDNIELKIPEGDLEAKLDPHLLRRVLVNLIENAVQAMPKGGKLEIACSRVGSELLITIKDTGIGMPREVVENIFKPFFTTKPKGAGFGLYTSKRIVEAQGGKISVESEVGKGTIFTIRIPVKQ